MTSCVKCSFFPSMEEKGQLLFYSREKEILTRIHTTFDGKWQNETVYIPYKSYDEIERICDEILEMLSSRQCNRLSASWMSETETIPSIFPKMVPFPEVYEQIHHREYVTIINNGLFTQHLQPIISLENSEVFGYEFLLRPSPNAPSFYPGVLFAFSQKAGLQSLLDSQARITSIELSSRLLQKGMKRFINFLPSSIYDPSHCLKSTFQAVKQFDVDPSDLVFEVVETEKIADIEHLKKIFHTYQQHGIHVALDDLGSGFATLDVIKALKPNYAKIDRHLIDHCDRDKEKQKKLKDIQEIATIYGISLLAEGIERREELEYCRDLHIQLAQGYYIGKPQPSPM